MTDSRRGSSSRTGRRRWRIAGCFAFRCGDAKQQLNAADAERLGLINEIVAKDKVYPRAMELAEQMAIRPRFFLP